jgi:DNA-binding NarL/FixJ family response regulator
VERNLGKTLTTPEIIDLARAAATEKVPESKAAATEKTASNLTAGQNHDGLSGREVEVLRLVAQGLTNARIAEALVISPLTVNAHLRQIYSKLGLTSRSAATRYAIEHNLA